MDIGRCSMSPSVYVVRYLVLKALAGKHSVVSLLYDYFVLNRSPSELARVYGYTKHQVRGYIQRISEKVGLGLARAILRRATPHILRIRSVVEPINGEYAALCSLCGERIPREVAETHLSVYHGDLVEELVLAVLYLMKSSKTVAR